MLVVEGIISVEADEHAVRLLRDKAPTNPIAKRCLLVRLEMPDRRFSVLI